MENTINNNSENSIIPIHIDDSSSINDDECIFCHDKNELPLINYQHTCGTYKIHQKCLDDWFILNNISCIICRENIIDISNSPVNRISPNNSESSLSYSTSSSGSQSPDYDTSTQQPIITNVNSRDITSDYTNDLNSEEEPINNKKIRKCSYLCPILTTIALFVII